MAQDWIIDADAHLTEPPDVWVERVPAKYRKLVPHVERNDEGADVWMLQGTWLGSVGGTAPAGANVGLDETPRTYADVHPAAFQAADRLALMDEVGIWAQVLYPNVAGFGAQRFLGLGDPELMLVCVQAYNDFLADWCAEDSRRLVGVSATPFWDPAVAAVEIQRSAELGHRGILMTGEPQAFGMPHIGDHHWDPIWDAADRCGLPVHFHLGSGDMSKTFTPARVAAHGRTSTYAFSAVELFMKNAVQVCDLLLSGVLDRYPTLNFVSVESGIGWIPFLLEAADYSYREAAGAGERGTPPSELFARQVYACCWFEQFAPQHLLDQIPVGNVLFETDFPHPISLYGNVRETIEGAFADVAPEARQQILWGNSARLYGIDEPVA